MPSQTGSIDLTSQVAANNNAISVASDDATTKANNAAKTATNYITADSNGIKIHMTDNSTTYQHQSATGTNFYVNSLKRSEVGGEGLKVFVGDTAGSETEIGHFGEYTRIGDIESSHTTISPLPNAGVAMYDETGSTRALRVATSGLYIGSDDTAHFSDDGFTLFPQGSDVGDVVRLNAGSIGTQRTNITRTIKLEANETLSTLSLSGAPTISNIYRNTTALVKGTDYIQQTTTNSGGVDWEYNSTKDGHYINTNIIFNPAITGPASVIIECGVLVPQNYYMRMGPEWYNHTVIDDEGFRVINYNGDPVFNVDMASDGTSSVTVGESDKQHMVLDAAGLSAYDENGDYAEINGIVDGKNIKPNSVTANSINTENLVVGISQVESLSSSMAWQGTCATAAGTAAKAVTCTGFTLNSGATITVRFTTANTSAAALSLNVNSTGAKTIYVAGTATAAANQLLWAANATISFTYDGTYWRVTSEPRNWYGACTIAATTAAKTATINEVVLCKGSTVNLQMTNANAVANPTLNITSLGAKDIYTANAKLTATSSNNWSAASTIPFVFDGQNFRYDSEASSKANSIEIGGRNLLLDSADRTKWQLDTPTGYNLATISLSENLVKGEQYTLQVWGTVGRSDKNNNAIFNAYWGGGSVALGAMIPNTERNYWTLTFIAPNTTHATTANAWLNLYNTTPAGAFGTTYSSNVLKAKLERGNRLTDWTPAPEDVTEYTDNQVEAVQNNLDNLKIGGRNLFLNTGSPSATKPIKFVNTSAGPTLSGSLSFDGDESIYTSSSASSEHYIRFVPTSNFNQSIISNGLETPGSFVFSGLFKQVATSETLVCAVRIQVQIGTSTNWLNPTSLTDLITNNVLTNTDRMPIATGTTDYIPFAVCVVLPENVTGMYISFQQYGSFAVDDKIYYRHLKLEKGTKATDWTPAPEDVAADISTAQTTANNATPKADAIKRTQRIYYRSNSATAPPTPGTASSNWVTKSDDGTGVWTKMHVAISSTHKYVYTCEQYQFANETVGYTTVLRDNTITVIDGGNIITGSVAANSINASSGTFDEANIPDLKASKITAGDISADRIKTNVISAINSLTAGQINASRVNIEDAAIFTNGRLTNANITKTANTIPDTRNTNQPPSWYFTNYPRQSVTEFKSTSVIGLTGGGYCYLTTVTQWTDKSGGYPKQTAQVDSKFYYRTGISDSEWGSWSDTESATDKAYAKLQSRGEQLIVNGNGFLGDNTNFSSWTFDGSKANGSPGSFTRSNTVYGVLTSDEFFPVDPSKNYKVEFDVTSSGSGINAQLYGMFLFYDVDKLAINVQMCSYIVGSTTTLAQELKNGDTTVYLTDASGFIDTNATHQRSLIFWDYTNSFGYTYPPETYSRNFVTATEGLWSDYSKIDKTNNTITLTSPWNKGSHAAGTPVSQNSSGATYAYYWYTSNVVPDQWTHASSVYEGYQPAGIANAGSKFYRGTAYCKLGWLWNYSGTAANPQRQLWITNVSVKEDVPSSADTVKRTQRIYYRKNTSGAPSTPSTAAGNWVTQTGDVFGQWTTKVPRLTANADGTGTKYLYLYTCEQREMGNGKLAYTNVLLDDSTTIINGGNIITGSIAANSIDATSGTFNEANIPNLNANKITAGDISADRIKTNVINAINSLTAGQINAERINAQGLEVSAANITGTLKAESIQAGSLAIGVFTQETQNNILNSNVDVPENTSDLRNDSGFQTSKQVGDELDILSDKISDIDKDLYGTIIYKTEEGHEEEIDTTIPGIFATTQDIAELTDYVNELNSASAQNRETLNNNLAELSDTVNDNSDNLASISKDLYGYSYTDATTGTPISVDPVFVTPDFVDNKIDDLYGTVTQDIETSLINTSNNIDQKHNEIKTELKNYVRIINENEQSILKLGQIEPSITTVITDSSFDFKTSSDLEPIVSIGSDTNGGLFKTTRASIGQLDIGENTLGHWEWQQRANGNLALKWITTNQGGE